MFGKIQRAISSLLRSRRARIGDVLDITGSRAILRRYFVMNAFDGALTSLGVVIGAYVADIAEPRDILFIALSTGLAMAVSGMSGAYMTEKAERERELDDLEKAMLTSLESSMHGKAVRYISIMAALIDGLAPLTTAFIGITPFLLATFGLLHIYYSYVLSALLLLACLFALGMYLGKLSSKSLLFSGVKMVITGLVVSLLSLLLENLH